jgi:hypothetical protein
MLQRLWFVIVFLLAISSVFLRAQAASGQAPSHPTNTPYKGDLSIFEYLKRDATLQPQRILSLLGTCRISSVADIGAGSGWLTSCARSLLTRWTPSRSGQK